jgi:hypothetical protein
MEAGTITPIPLNIRVSSTVYPHIADFCVIKGARVILRKQLCFPWSIWCTVHPHVEQKGEGP